MTKRRGNNMKVVARGKEDGWYIVSLPEYKGKLHSPVYLGDGNKGVITSMANVSKRYWSEDELEDLRNTNTPIPENVKKHINKLMEEAKNNND